MKIVFLKMGKNRLEKSVRDNIHNYIKRERRERMEKKGEESDIICV